MLKKQKNALFDTVKKEGFDPELFQARENIDVGFWSFLWGVNGTFTIFLRDSFLSFHLKDTEDKFSVQMTGFPEARITENKKKIDFDEVLTLFRTWLNTDIKAYLEEQELPDLWLEVETYKSVLKDTEYFRSGGDSDFSEKEKTDIRSSIAKYKVLLEENFHPNKEQTEFINDQLEHLTTAVDRLDRIDWLGLVISTLIGIAINLSVDTEKGKLLFSLFKYALDSGTNLLQ